MGIFSLLLLLLNKLVFNGDFQQSSKLKVWFGHHLATNSFRLGRLFTNQVASFKILGAMTTKVVATWRVV